MAQELIYTSAPQGLKPGTRGFCTVACTQGMVPQLIDKLESLSGYRHLYAAGGVRTAIQQVVSQQVQLTAGRRRWHVLSQIRDAGIDYSQRSNKFAYHVVLDPSELPPAGPAWLLTQPGFMPISWTGEPRTLPPAKSLPTGQSSPAICRHWAARAGDAGWGGVLAGTVVAERRTTTSIIIPQGYDPLPLVVESLALLPEHLRWQVGFSTYFTRLPPGVECDWRFYVEGTQEATAAARSQQGLLIDLRGPLARAQDGPLVESARTGVPASIPASPPYTPKPISSVPDDEELARLLAGDQPTAPWGTATKTRPGLVLDEPYEIAPGTPPLLVPPIALPRQRQPFKKKRPTGWLIAGGVAVVAILVAAGAAMWLVISQELPQTATTGLTTNHTKTTSTNKSDKDDQEPKSKKPEEPKSRAEKPEIEKPKAPPLAVDPQQSKETSAASSPKPSEASPSQREKTGTQVTDPEKQPVVIERKSKVNEPLKSGSSEKRPLESPLANSTPEASSGKALKQLPGQPQPEDEPSDILMPLRGQVFAIPLLQTDASTFERSDSKGSGIQPEIKFASSVPKDLLIEIVEPSQKPTFGVGAVAEADGKLFWPVTFTQDAPFRDGQRKEQEVAKFVVQGKQLTFRWTNTAGLENPLNRLANCVLKLTEHRPDAKSVFVPLRDSVESDPLDLKWLKNDTKNGLHVVKVDVSKCPEPCSPKLGIGFRGLPKQMGELTPPGESKNRWFWHIRAKTNPKLELVFTIYPEVNRQEGNKDEVQICIQLIEVKGVEKSDWVRARSQLNDNGLPVPSERAVTGLIKQYGKEIGTLTRDIAKLNNALDTAKQARNTTMQSATSQKIREMTEQVSSLKQRKQNADPLVEVYDQLTRRVSLNFRVYYTVGETETPVDLVSSQTDVPTDKSKDR